MNLLPITLLLNKITPTGSLERALGLRPAVAVAMALVCCLLFVPLGAQSLKSEPAVPSRLAQRPVSISTQCLGASQLLRLKVTVDGNRAVAHATCLKGTEGQTDLLEHSVALSFTAQKSDLQSVYAPGNTVGKVSVTLDPNQSNRQVASITGTDGSHCATITATGVGATPVPKRFMSSSNDWGSSIDYMVDDRCRMLAITLGNQLAILPLGKELSFDLYHVHFAVGTNGETEK